MATLFKCYKAQALKEISFSYEGDFDRRRREEFYYIPSFQSIPHSVT